MVFPLYDDNTDRRCTPFVTWVLIAINVVIFIGPQEMGAEDNKFTYTWSCVPEEIVTGKDVAGRVPVGRDPRTGEVVAIPLEETPISVYLTLLLSMFMHGGWAHLIGNMLFLWIFGDNVEDFLGHVRFIIFYLVCGVLASLAHVATTYILQMDPRIPSLGASGAISGVLGGYILLFPHKRVMAIVFRFLTEVPAWVAIGIWFAFQLIESLGMLGGVSGGVAYGAHIGGFLAGLALVKLFAVGATPPPRATRGPPRETRWRPW